MRTDWKKLKRNIPNKVRTTSRTQYEVLWIDGFVTEVEGQKTYGETRYQPKQIVLNTNQGARECVHTMYHELLHALSAELDANLTESQVIALEKSFNAVREFILTLEGKKKVVKK